MGFRVSCPLPNIIQTQLNANNNSLTSPYLHHSLRGTLDQFLQDYRKNHDSQTSVHV